MTPPQLLQGLLTREMTGGSDSGARAVRAAAGGRPADQRILSIAPPVRQRRALSAEATGSHRETKQRRRNGEDSVTLRFDGRREATRADGSDRENEHHTIEWCSFSRSDPSAPVGRPRRPTRRTTVFSVRPSMFRAAVKLIAINECSSVLAAEQTAHPIGGPRRRPTLTRISARATRAGVHACRRCPSSSSRASGCASWVCAPSPRLLSEHARLSRGPLRLCSLDPDTSAAVPVSVSVARARPGRTPYPQHACDASAIAYAAFSTAPAGITPVVAYRHSAISSFRASATMPIRRARLPVPKCVRYHCVSALCGCHCTQLHAS